MNTFIIKLLFFLCLMVSIPHAQAGWFSSQPNEQHQKLMQMENQLQSQRQTTDQWEAVAGSLAVGCVLLFVIGTALGAKTRRHATLPTTTNA